MADLLADRVTPGGPALASVDINCFGLIAFNRGRSLETKYECLFACLSSRAVHIEVAESLDTDSFLNCQQRSIARRGFPDLIRSHTGRKIVGAKRELSQGLQEWNQERIEGDLSEKGVRWLFNTPTASYMGGAWERQIRSIRRILSGLTWEQVMTSEMLYDIASYGRGHHE